MIASVWIFIGGVALLMIGAAMSSGCPRYEDDFTKTDHAIYDCGSALGFAGMAIMVIGLVAMLMHL